MTMIDIGQFPKIDSESQEFKLTRNHKNLS